MNKLGVKHVVKINLPGGIVYPGDLLEILAIARQAGVKNFRFGNRQQLIFCADVPAIEDIEYLFSRAEIPFEINTDVYPNIVSSYVTDDILNAANWLREGVYKDILNAFNFRPTLKINIIDYTQNLTPFFTGHLNFISSELSNYWFLHVRYPSSTEMYAWPTLIYTEDIPLISRLIEEALTDLNGDGNIRLKGETLYKHLVDVHQLTGRPYELPMEHTSFKLPYYEGFNSYGTNKFWLGIYRRNEEFSIELLEDIAEICLKTRVGQLYTTAWKSIIIKSIKLDDRKYWSHLLDKHRISVRHAATELNWQLEEVCEEALNLKLHLARCFEEADIRTFGLCFAIKTKPKTGLFGSVIIKKLKQNIDDNLALFEISHTNNFNPNSKEFVVFEKAARQQDLAYTLIALVEHYYSLQLNFALPRSNKSARPKEINELLEVHQCKHCKTVYNQTYGDEINNIEPGVTFTEIENYFCPMCEAPKEDFEKVNIQKILV